MRALHSMNRWVLVGPAAAVLWLLLADSLCRHFTWEVLWVPNAPYAHLLLAPGLLALHPPAFTQPLLFGLEGASALQLLQDPSIGPAVLVSRRAYKEYSLSASARTVFYLTPRRGTFPPFPRRYEFWESRPRSESVQPSPNLSKWLSVMGMRPSRIVIACPCSSESLDEALHIAIKSDIFMHAWTSALQLFPQGSTINFEVVECPIREQVREVFHTSGMFRPSELVKRDGNRFEFAVSRDLLALRMKLLTNPTLLGMKASQEILEDPALLKENKKVKSAIAITMFSEDFLCGVKVLGATLTAKGSRLPRIVLAGSAISTEVKEELKENGWQIRELPPLKQKVKGLKDRHVAVTYQKLTIFGFEEFDRILYMDCDMLPLHNVDYLAKFPTIVAAFDPGFPFNSGIMIIEPKTWLFEFMQEMLDYLPTSDSGDQGFLNRFFGFFFLLPDRYVAYRLNPDQFFEYQQIVPETALVHQIGLNNEFPWLRYRNNDTTTLRFRNLKLQQLWYEYHDSYLESSCAVDPKPETT